jgi:quercetin dioxygenase-like cupin family protein
MIRKTSSITLALLSAFIFICSCNDSTRTETVLAEPDSASIAATQADNVPKFDTSKSVTAISPDLYRELADTLNIRMVEGVYKPGDSSIMHQHPDFAMYVVKGGLVELTSKDGVKQNVEFKDNMSVIMPMDTHSAKNVGKTTLRLIVVEVNRPRGD